MSESLDNETASNEEDHSRTDDDEDENLLTFDENDSIIVDSTLIPLVDATNDDLMTILNNPRVS